MKWRLLSVCLFIDHFQLQCQQSEDPMCIRTLLNRSGTVRVAYNLRYQSCFTTLNPPKRLSWLETVFARRRAANPSAIILPTRIQTDVISDIELLLQSKNLYGGTFSNIGEHSPIANIRAALQEVKSSKSDTIISVGGGSPIDASKAIIYYAQQELGGEFMKQIAIPTTLSAAEYTVNNPL